MIEDSSTRSKWSVTNESVLVSDTVLSYNDHLHWDRKCEWIYNDDYLNDDDDSTCSSDGNIEDESNHESEYETPTQNDPDIIMNMEDLNDEQKMIVSLYSNYLLEDNEASAAKPPPIVLLTGIGGTGKSFVIHKLLEYKTMTAFRQSSRQLTTI